MRFLPDISDPGYGGGRQLFIITYIHIMDRGLEMWEQEGGGESLGEGGFHTLADYLLSRPRLEDLTPFRARLLVTSLRVFLLSEQRSCISYANLPWP